MSGELGSLSDFSIQRANTPVRFLGLDLAGAKNNKTALAALEYYPKEGKIFLIDLYEKMQPIEGESNDVSLLELIQDLSVSDFSTQLDSFEKAAKKSQNGANSRNPKRPRLGVNVPLQLPPCLTCTLKECKEKPGVCAKPETKWAKRYLEHLPQKKWNQSTDFTGYTQRPVEAYIRHAILGELDSELQFDIDETMGGNRAPLTARMIYLKKYLKNFELLEVWPKLIVAQLSARYEIERRLYRLYRDLEEGASARHQLLDALMEHAEIFIYERDQRKITQNLAAFDAFLCAYGALLAYLEDTVAPPRGFPLESGWVTFPPVTDYVPTLQKNRLALKRKN